MRQKWLIAVSLSLGLGLFALAASPPAQIAIGTVYAGSGPFASSSLPEYQGLQYWAQQVNKEGGVFVKAYNKKIPVKLVAYDDQSSTTLAATLYTQLITQDKVDLLVSDFGSVLTSVAVPIAREHKRLLLDITGTSASFFKPGNPYVVLASLPTSGVWPETLAGFLVSKEIKRIAILFNANDFDQSQAETLKAKLEAAGVNPVYYHAIPTSTSNYAVLLHAIAAQNPDALIEFGYPNNDIAFFQNLGSSGLKFKMVFTVFPGQLLELLQGNVGAQNLAYTYTYPTPPLLVYNKVNYGLGMDAFKDAFKAAGHKKPNFLNVAGYNVGLVAQKILETAPEFNQLAFRDAVTAFSGKLFTLDGLFRINAYGAQIGETLPVAQLVPNGKSLKVVVVWPKNVATGKAIYPTPTH